MTVRNAQTKSSLWSAYAPQAFAPSDFDVQPERPGDYARIRAYTVNACGTKYASGWHRVSYVDACRVLIDGACERNAVERLFEEPLFLELLRAICARVGNFTLTHPAFTPVQISAAEHVLRHARRTRKGNDNVTKVTYGSVHARTQQLTIEKRIETPAIDLRAIFAAALDEALISEARS